MRSLVLLALLVLPVSSVAQQPLRPAPIKAFATNQNALAKQRVDCVANRVQHARPGEPLKPRTLDELPPGQLYLSVMREVDGCQEMVLASEERNRATLRR